MSGQKFVWQKSVNQCNNTKIKKKNNLLKEILKNHSLSKQYRNFNPYWFKILTNEVDNNKIFHDISPTTFNRFHFESFENET